MPHLFDDTLPVRFMDTFLLLSELKYDVHDEFAKKYP